MVAARAINAKEVWGAETNAPEEHIITKIAQYCAVPAGLF